MYISICHISLYRYHVLSLLSAWHYSEDDVVLHALPLHHVHGILNILLSPLACGASVVMHEKFEPGKVSKLSTCIICNSKYVKKRS